MPLSVRKEKPELFVLARTGDTVSGTWGAEIVMGMVRGLTVSLALTDTADRDARHATDRFLREGYVFATSVTGKVSSGLAAA